MKHSVLIAAILCSVLLGGAVAFHTSRRAQARRHRASYADAESALRTTAAYHYRHCTTRHWRPAMMRP
jgi:hypothetical protein